MEVTPGKGRSFLISDILQEEVTVQKGGVHCSSNMPQVISSLKKVSTAMDRGQCKKVQVTVLQSKEQSGQGDTASDAPEVNFHVRKRGHGVPSPKCKTLRPEKKSSDGYRGSTSSQDLSQIIRANNTASSRKVPSEKITSASDVPKLDPSTTSSPPCPQRPGHDLSCPLSSCVIPAGLREGSKLPPPALLCPSVLHHGVLPGMLGGGEGALCWPFDFNRPGAFETSLTRECGVFPVMDLPMPFPFPFPFTLQIPPDQDPDLTLSFEGKRCRRSRTVFTELQLLGLERRFESQKYLSTPDRLHLAEHLGLSQIQVKTWYQNRRMKWKKQVLKEGGTESPTKPKGRPRKSDIL